MPQPYDYTPRNPADVGDAIAAYRVGTQDRREADTEQRTNALRRYMPDAINGNQEALNQVTQLDPETGLKLRAELRQTSDADLKRKLSQIDTLGQLLKASGGNVATVKAQAGRLGLDPASIASLDDPAEVQSFLALSPSVRAMAAEELDRRVKEGQLGVQQANIRQSDAAAAASRANADYIRGGKGSPGGRGFKPMDSKRQGNENQWLAEIQTAGNLASDTGGFLSQIETGELNPSLLANAYNDAKSWAGVVDENDPAAINYNRYRAFLERMRNDSLLLAKGVQTEGDAKRAWDALFRGMNSTAIVKAQLANIQRINERAAKQKAGLIRNQRKGFFGPAYEEPDWADIGVDPTLFQSQAPSTSFTRGGAGVFSDTQAGQPTAAPAGDDGWSIKRVR